MNIVVIGYSWEQMEPLMAKLWLLAPKDELHPKCGYDQGRGITGKPPRLVFSSGPGKGSVIKFGTYKQGAARVAGATVHRVYCDEPPPERILGEIMPRVMNRRGHIRLGFTPTPDMPDVLYIRDRVEAGSIIEHNRGIFERNCWPEGNPAPWLFQHEIDEYEQGLLEVEREMRMGRSWVPVVTGRVMDKWTDANVRAFDMGDLAGAWLAVGTDHGAAAGKQASVLVAIMGHTTIRPHAYVVDESVAEGLTAPEHDAANILAMLQRHRLGYDDVDLWIGDRPTGSDRYDIRKSNKDLRRELAHQLRRPITQTRPIKQPKKWSGSLTAGMRLLNTLAGRRDDDDTPHLVVHPRCEQFISGCREFNGDPRHKFKDPLDAGRYAIERSVRREAGVALVARY